MRLKVLRNAHIAFIGSSDVVCVPARARAMTMTHHLEKITKLMAFNYCHLEISYMLITQLNVYNPGANRENINCWFCVSTAPVQAYEAFSCVRFCWYVCWSALKYRWLAHCACVWHMCDVQHDCMQRICSCVAVCLAWPGLACCCAPLRYQHVPFFICCFFLFKRALAQLCRPPLINLIRFDLLIVYGGPQNLSISTDQHTRTAGINQNWAMCRRSSGRHRTDILSC